MSDQSIEQLIPADRTRIGKEPFHFHCHSGVDCYLSCCRNVDMLLFPYDILRLKKHLGIHSKEFLEKYTTLCEGSHPFFPGLRLALAEDSQKSCPFLGPEGCTVYPARPSACRTYPVERGVEGGQGRKLKVHYFLTHHPYCHGHAEAREYTIRQWERDQRLAQYNLYNDLWAELDAFFATNPWQGEGAAGPYQKMAFMACFNIDDFRDYVAQHRILEKFRLQKDHRRRIQQEDEALLQFAFQWLEMILGGRKTLQPK